MNGFKPKKKTYNLIFEDPDYEGLIVKVKSLKVDFMLEVMDLAKLSELDINNLTAEDTDGIKKMFTVIADIVDEWNLLGDDDEVVPITYEGVSTLDIDIAITILMASFEGIMGVSAPLDQKSTGGKPSEVPQMPMALQ